MTQHWLTDQRSLSQCQLAGLVAKPLQNGSTNAAHFTAVDYSDCIYSLAWQASHTAASQSDDRAQQASGRLSMLLPEANSSKDALAAAMATLQGAASGAGTVSLDSTGSALQGLGRMQASVASQQGALWGMLRTYAQESTAAIGGHTTDVNASPQEGRSQQTALTMTSRHPEQRADAYGTRHAAGALHDAVLLRSDIRSVPGACELAHHYWFPRCRPVLLCDDTARSEARMAQLQSPFS